MKFKIGQLMTQLFLLTTLLFWQGVAHADSVGQVQTTKYFAPETVAMIKQRVQDVANHVPGATLGFQTGDTVSYIIQFTPIANTTTIGAGGYITDYIPAGTQVTGAWFVQPDGNGGFYQTSPPAPAQMANGFGVGGAGGYVAGWTSDTYTINTCTAAALTLLTCTGNLAQLYADTGIFYSTDPRTAVFVDPSTDGRVRQWGATTGGNGYYVNATRNTQLVPLMGGTSGTNLPTTHNFWDAAMTNAFGTNVLPANAPNSGIAKIDTNGAGLPPFNAGSPIAGPQTGYQLDYTGQVGPWQRIAYPGSMIGSNAFSATNPAKAAGTNTVLATSTSAGTSFPLPANTNAVRWAAGRLVVGTQSYVKISLQLTSSPPAMGLVNNSEVFGGDGSPESAGGGNRDSAWVYHVPSVASNTSSLYILKEIICVYDATGTCVANNGANLPTTGTPATVGPKVRYRLTYINSNNGTQHNVVVCDQLPNLAGLTFANVTPVSSLPNAGSPTSPAVAACGFAAGGVTFNYASIPSLAGGGSGVITYDVQYPVLTAGTVLNNAGKVVSTELPSGVTSYAPSNVVASLTANLLVSKSVSPSNANKGDTVTYTVNIINTGSNAAGLTSLADTLPGVAAGAAPATAAGSRFNYVATSNVTLNGAPLSGVTSAMTLPTATNEVVTWTFPQGTSVPGGGQLVLVFTATAGGAGTTNSMVYGTAYTNTATATYTGGAAGTATTGATAPVTISIPSLTLTKTIDCVYSGATCTAGSYVAGSSIPPNAKLGYKIVYANPEAAAQTVTVGDILPTQIALSPNPISNLVINGTPTAAPAAVANPATTALLSSSTLTGYGSGIITFDLQTSSVATNVVTNTGTINSTQRTAAGGAAVSSVVSATAASLTISKAVSSSTVAPGGVMTYTVTVQNTGAVGVPVTSVVDTLPFASVGTIAYTATTSLVVNGVAQTGVAGAAAAGQYTNPAPAAAVAGASQVVTWTLPAAGTTINAGQSLVLTFTATYAATVPRGTTQYKNAATVNYTGGSASTGPVAPVTVPYNTISVSKAVLSPVSASTSPTSQVGYAITVTNTGTTPVAISGVVDSLPAGLVGTIGYLSTSSVTVAGVAQTATATNPPTVAGQYNVAASGVAAAGAQHQVTWTFPSVAGAAATILQAAQSMVINFVAQYTGVQTGNVYYNDVRTDFNGGLSTNVNVTNQAPVTVPLTSKITKTIDCVYVGATCTAGSFVDGSAIPVNAKVGYKIVYENLSATASATGISITDTLPPYVAANAISNLVVNGVSTVAPANTAGTPPSTSPPAVTLLTGGTLPVAPSSGTITFALQTNATAGAGVTNTGKMVSAQDPVGVTSSATAAAAGGNLTVTKAVTTNTSSTVAQGGTVSYTISVVNDGVANATLTSLVDTLPGVAAAAPGTTSRFTYTATGTLTLNGVTVAPAYTAVVTAPAAPATTNKESVTWTFTGGVIIPAGQTFTLTFTALVGSAVSKGAAAPGATYYNDVTANYTGGAFTNALASGQAPVLVPFNTLTMSKTIDCVYDTQAIPVCQPYLAGSPVPVNAKLRYQLAYSNIAPAAQTVTIKDTLPAAVTSAGNLYVLSGPDVRPTSAVLSVNSAAVGAARGADVALTAIAGGTVVATTARSLPANSSGSMFIDMQTAAAGGSSLANCASISTVATDTCATAGVVSSTATAAVLNMAVLGVTKATTTPTLTPGNRATYTITIQNTGSAATSALKVLDFLPFDGTTADITKRLNYFATTSYAVNGVVTALAPSISTSQPPLVSPYASNTNQQQVQWDFGNYALAAGATLTITFTADTGANMTTGVSYSNSAQTQYTSAGVSMVSTVNNTAPIRLIPHVTLSKTVVGVCSGVGCTPTAYTAGTAIPANATLRYQIVYTNPSSTDAQTNVVLSDVLPTQTAAAAVSNVTIVSGLITAPSAGTLSGLAAGGATLNFPTLASLPANATGTITLDVQTTAPVASSVANTARVVSTEDANGVSSTATVNTTSLVVSKTITHVCSGAGCTPAAYVAGTVIPVNAKVRYQLVYSNASATTAQTNVVLSDILPTQTAAAAVSNVVIVSGSITAPSAPTLAALAAGGATLNFPTLASLPASGTGTITLDVQTTAAAGATVSNTGKLVSTEDPTGVTSVVSNSVNPITLSKSTSTPNTSANGTATYTISITNAGAVPTTSLQVWDFLPFDGATASLAKRMSYSATSGYTLNAGAITPTVTIGTNVPPLVSSHSGNPNQQEVKWDFGAYSLPAAGVLTITFDAAVGASMTATTYNNDLQASFGSASGSGTTVLNGTAPINVTVGQNLSGAVFSDANHNGLLDSGETWSGAPTVYAKLFAGACPASGTASSVQTLTAPAGTYTFTGVAAGSYCVVLSNNATANVTTASVPAGWLNTSPSNGMLNVTVGSVDLTGRNFGLYNGSQLTGRVFNDNGNAGGTANDGVQNGAEAGLAGIALRANNALCAASLCDSTSTNGAGDYTLWIPAVASGTVNVVESNTTSYVSTGGQVGNTAGAYTRASDTTAFTYAAGSVYSGVNFADVPPNQFMTDGAQNALPGSVVYYPHTFTAGTAGSVVFSLGSATNPAVPAWSQLMYQDSNCNGTLDAAEPVMPVSVSVAAGQSLCVIVKQFVPSGAAFNAQNLITINAAFSYANAAALGVVNYSHTDLTVVGAATSAGLVLTKTVNAATAVPGQNLTYTITYTNQSTGVLSNVVVSDMTPAYTLFQSASCGTLPLNLSGCVIAAPVLGGTGAISYTMGGTLAAGASGTVSFVVQVQP